jgi:hypothetical protein
MIELRWSPLLAAHIADRSGRYPGGFDIEVGWTVEAAADPSALVIDPDPRSNVDGVRVVGYSAGAQRVLTIVAVRIDGELWGSTAWPTSGRELREYETRSTGGEDD